MPLRSVAWFGASAGAWKRFVQPVSSSAGSQGCTLSTSCSRMTSPSWGVPGNVTNEGEGPLGGVAFGLLCHTTAAAAASAASMAASLGPGVGTRPSENPGVGNGATTKPGVGNGAASAKPV
eukprot:CAMPEP_0183482872 /NCGR_PEP_ID=MMETSP0370-20130417/177421_1 /TAXON_ID=268820 /ORGANISM="Peridinium aciculiferum, Strain PAER-2" /LENGTH=120 /DNA_ID=CAMNT_0025676087 /DNA_START=53 /DNA_END=412 /DNA_ORIENTATION=+